MGTTSSRRGTLRFNNEGGAWAKSVGKKKMSAEEERGRELVFPTTQVRGERSKGASDKR